MNMLQMRPFRRSRQIGVVLVTSLLLLLVVTIMALSIFRSFGMQEKIAGNTREKQRALQAATSTQQYAEWWLANKSYAPTAVGQGIASSGDVICNSLIDANTNSGLAAGQICSNTLAAAVGVSVTAWPTLSTSITNNGVGVAYTPPCVSIATPASTTSNTNCPSATDTYYARPRFYITDLGPLATGQGEVYQVDAYSYGLTPATIAVVESTVSITCKVCNLGGL
jgi:type IV pilus assembly protein PilX